MDQITSTIEEAKSELAAVLASAAFVRSARMASLLNYLCSKYFAGESDGLKEYSIAVEVLGRPPSFDPSTDAIARVEVHRLRRKLREFYDGEGSGRHLQITIPTGSYVPIFSQGAHPSQTQPALAPIEQNPLEHLPANGSNGALVAVAVPQVALAPRVDRGNRRFLVLAAAIVLVLAGSLFLFFRPKFAPTPDRSRASLVSASSVLPALPADNFVRILCGQTKSHTDRMGAVWGPDRFFSGGGAFDRTNEFLARTYDDNLFRYGRMGNFTYDIPLQPGVYELHLYFAETTFGQGTMAGGGETSRIFTVQANDIPILADFDIISDAFGTAVADVRVFKDISPAADGALHLRFTGLREQAIVSSIELIPTHPHRLNPILITVGDNSYTDSSGQLWMPDNYFSGGQKTHHTSVVQASHDPDLYRAERFGNFSYNIPVAPGLYDVAIHLAETYWGPDNQGRGGVGSRVFDIFCNGVALARSLDVFKEVGSNRELVEHFSHLRPNAQGKLCLSFIPVHNYASVYGIEVHNVGE